MSHAGYESLRAGWRAGAIAMWRPLQQAAVELAQRLPLASWAHAIGASSVMRSVLGTELQGTCFSSCPTADFILTRFVCASKANLVLSELLDG